MTQNKGPNLIEAKLLNFQNFVATARVLKIYEMVLSIQLFGFVSLLKTHEKTHVDSKPHNSSNKTYTQTYKDIHDVRNVLFEGNAQFVIIVFGCIVLAILPIGSC